jgi:two-component system, OmpR family, response regulator ChvI
MPIQLRESAFALASSPLASSPQNEVADEPRIRLILVDDDELFREAAAGELDYLGFDVTAYGSGEALLDDIASVKDADVIVLDWKLPTGNGTELLKQLRERGIAQPIVFLTGMPATTYESAALDRGAVDFVDKARGVPILAKRLRLVAGWSKREVSRQGRPSLRVSHLALRPELMRATWKDQDLHLTLTEFNIVYLLASQAGEYVTYRSVYDCVHHAGFIAGDGEHGFRTNVRSSIKRIRNKFRSIDSEFTEIENFAALGYRWRASPITVESRDPRC